MSRWIIFDQAAAEAVKSQCGVSAEMREHATNLLAETVQAETAVAVLPSPTPGKLLVMRTSRSHALRRPAVSSSNLAPSGFLGLTDAIDMDSEPEPPKTWWQKIIG